MEEVSFIVGAVARVLVVIGGGLSTVMVGYAGIMWMTSAGDPQGMSKARMALLGALGGLVMVGVGFIVPRVVHEVVIGPLGGVELVMDVGVDCDQMLREQLVFQRGASDAEKMNVVIRAIQRQRKGCEREVWDPFVDDLGYSVVVGQGNQPGTGACFSIPAPVGKDVDVGDLLVPRGLRQERDMDKSARKNSGRDADNNVIVYWGNGSRRPADSAGCWLFVSRLRVWGSNY